MYGLSGSSLKEKVKENLRILGLVNGFLLESNILPIKPNLFEKKTCTKKHKNDYEK